MSFPSLSPTLLQPATKQATRNTKQVARNERQATCLLCYLSLPSLSLFLSLLYLSSANDKTSSWPLNIHARSGILLKAITDALCECIHHIRLAKLHINIHNLLLHLYACVCVCACQISIICIAYFSAQN